MQKDNSSKCVKILKRYCRTGWLSAWGNLTVISPKCLCFLHILQKIEKILEAGLKKMAVGWWKPSHLLLLWYLSRVLLFLLFCLLKQHLFVSYKRRKLSGVWLLLTARGIEYETISSAATSCRLPPYIALSDSMSFPAIM